MRKRYFEVIPEEKRKNAGADIVLPERGTSRAMAYDFFSPVDVTIKPGEIAKIWTDVRAFMQDDECLILNVRSSQGGKVMFAHTQGWIDSDYFYANNGGNIGVFLKNISDEDYVIKAGDRICQGAFFNFLTSDNGNTDKVREGGFGSTGV